MQIATEFVMQAAAQATPPVMRGCSTSSQWCSGEVQELLMFKV
jgi:hypothetical protein